jgi:hypothetical protein
MKWYRERDICPPNSHLTPDDDVQIQIEQTMAKLHKTFPTRWVKGHQTPKEDEELPWEATLNIEADNLANEARDETADQPDSFFQYPASKVMLYIRGQPITRNIAREIRFAWTSQDLRQYMTDKFNWKPKTADLIDWYSHGSTLKSYAYYQHVFCVKLIHERLPVLGEKFTASPNKICPCCKRCEETTEHYMECLKNPYQPEELRDALRPIYDKHEVDPILRLMINMATANQPINRDILEGVHPIIDFSPYYELIQEQEEIGWNQLNLGRYGLSWDRCQRRFLEEKHNKKITGEPKWIRNVIRETWAYQKARWLARNEELHGPSNNRASSAATKLALLTRIQALYKHEMDLLVQDRFPFDTEIADWEHKTATAMKQWIARNTPFIKHALKIAKLQHIRNSSDIRQYIPNAPVLRANYQTKTKRKKRNKPKSKDIRGFTTGNHRRPKAPNNLNREQITEQRPKQYKQGSILAFTNIRQNNTQTAQTETQNN